MVSIRSAVRDLGRLQEIYRVLVRHGFGEIAQRIGLGSRRPKALPATPGEATADPEAPPSDVALGAEEAQRITPAERVRLVAMDLGPSFVKLGQIASTRTDVLPAAWIAELKKLQDEVSPLPFSDIREQVERSLGMALSEVYESFEETPLAAASIGQVHRAVLKRGDERVAVVVKVQRPGVRETVARDLELLHALAKLIERAIPESKIYSPSALVDQFDRAITAELDFAREAEHAERFRKNFEGHPHARFPMVYREASTRQIITLELLSGVKIYEAIEKAGHHGRAIAQAAVAIVVKMIFEDGFFHADPHPGNILISGAPDHPIIGVIDLGMVGRLSPELRDKTVALMVAAVRKDHLAVADALYAIGTPTRKIDMRAYRADVSLLAEKYLGLTLKQIDLSAMIGDLVGGATRFGLEIPPDFLLVGKALMTIEGVSKEIDPDLDVLEQARPLFFDLLRKRYSPERVASDLWRGLERLSGAAYDVPMQVREILDDLRLGRLSLKTSDPTLPATVDRLGRRIFAGFVVAAFVAAGTWLVASERQTTLGLALLGFGVLVMLGHVAGDVARRKSPPS